MSKEEEFFKKSLNIPQPSKPGKSDDYLSNSFSLPRMVALLLVVLVLIALSFALLRN